MKVSTVFLALTALVHSADGQASKFAASWTPSNTMTLLEVTTSGGTDGGSGTGEHLASIKPPGNGKELLVGISGVINLLTFGEIVAPNKKGTGTIEAEATVNVQVRLGNRGATNICSSGIQAAPGEVTFISRRQAVSLDVDLEILCSESGLTNNPDGCQLTASQMQINGTVSVALGINTVGAHHFNFVIPNVPSGDFDVYACYTGSGGGKLDEGFGGKAKVYAAVLSRVVTVQQVKAVNTNLIDDSAITQL